MDDEFLVTSVPHGAFRDEVMQVFKKYDHPYCVSKKIAELAGFVNTIQDPPELRCKGLTPPLKYGGFEPLMPGYDRFNNPPPRAKVPLANQPSSFPLQRPVASPEPPRVAPDAKGNLAPVVYGGFKPAALEHQSGFQKKSIETEPEKKPQGTPVQYGGFRQTSLVHQSRIPGQSIDTEPFKPQASPLLKDPLRGGFAGFTKTVIPVEKPKHRGPDVVDFLKGTAVGASGGSQNFNAGRSSSGTILKAPGAAPPKKPIFGTFWSKEEKPTLKPIYTGSRDPLRDIIFPIGRAWGPLKSELDQARLEREAATYGRVLEPPVKVEEKKEEELGEYPDLGGDGGDDEEPVQGSLQVLCTAAFFARMDQLQLSTPKVSYPCKFCGRYFASLYDLKLHQTENHERYLK